MKAQYYLSGYISNDKRASLEMYQVNVLVEVPSELEARHKIVFVFLDVNNGDDCSTKAAPTSQIPGLSEDANNGPEERSKGRRTGVNESDSAYTKLAKQGGQRGKNDILFLNGKYHTLPILSSVEIKSDS